MAENPLVVPSDLPYQLPPFADIAEEHFLPAFEQGMAEHLAEVERIAADPAEPTIDNVIGALERAGRVLHRTSVAFFSLVASDSTDGIRALETEISPRLTAHSDAIHMHRGLYDRLRRVEATDPEEAWILERYRLDFARAGADLSDEDQARLRELNQELSRLSTTFRQALLEASTAEALVVDDPAQLDGLDPAAIEGLRQDDGTYRLPLLNFTNQPALAELTDRDVRRRLYELSIGRAAANRELAIRMAALRAERAALLGYPSHAAYAVADQTARTLDAVEDMLGRLSGPAVANARREAEALSEQAGFPIEPWDWSFYAEEVRAARYSIDEGAMRPYFELDRVYEEGVFRAAHGLYGLTFARRDDLAGYHHDVRTWEVLEEDGTPLGLFLLDPYARPTKRGGAWMNSLVDQSHLLGEQPVVVNNLNVTKPASGPTLLTYDEVRTAFHEFGHALHGLLSDVRFPRVSGTSVPRDFVEFPSQVNEMWATHPEVLPHYARHHETGEPMPRELVDKMAEAERFGQGFATLEYLKAALLDWTWHTIPEGTVVDDAEAFEAAAFEDAGVDFALVGSRYRTSYFAHIFGGGYSAGYYSYIWSEVLDADTVEWFEENGGLTRENGEHFRRTLLSRGGSGDPMDAFRAFRGRDPRIEPLLARRGLD
ncbi:M3 family metallopeptidase [Actinomarinicola tropica]|uniref:M3 family peptidase n=1 Tax=Actinomarinicola tropica TaxID=2789776 RepID=A0A5Q2RU23_9ACTN|nr:M3 family metallopeptidase [Actinomarinicola tropica]QGG96715.1 M3 family peptidase [Actinomarinicola tropica]